MADDAERKREYIKNLKYNAFMGTIAVCVVYGIIALLLILYINLTEQGKVLYNDLKPFALTFIFGTLFIIIMITILVLHWEPEQAKKTTVDDVLNNPLTCPDYYKLEKTTALEKTNLLKYTKGIQKDTLFGDTSDTTKQLDLNNYKIDDNNSHLITNKCLYDNSFFKDNIDEPAYDTFPQGASGDSSNPDAVAISSLTSNNDVTDLKTLGAFTAMYGGYGTPSATKGTSGTFSDGNRQFNFKKPHNNPSHTSLTASETIKYDCQKVYPHYLAQLDAQEYINNNEKGKKNLHRCEWAKKCGVPWTAAGCNKFQ